MRGVDKPAAKRYALPVLKNARLRLFVASALLCSVSLFAQNESEIYFDDSLNAVSAIVIDAATGTVLFEKDASREIPPASLTKLMTMHLALNEALRGTVSLDDIVALPPATWARNQPPRSSLMFLDEGQIVTLRELLLGLAIPSGNDAAVAIALHLAPSIEDFAAMMNAEAQRIGLTRTFFVEPSGISEKNMTTAADFALFCREYVRLHPETITDYHTVPALAYPQEENLPLYQRGRSRQPVIQPNHIPLLGEFEGADGLKTGYIDEAGYNAAVTAERDGTRFIAVVLGVPAELGARWGSLARAEDCRKLLEWAYANYKTLRPPAPEIPDVRVWKSKQKFAALKPAEDLTTTTPIGRGVDPAWEIDLFAPLIAPLAAGTEAGKLRLYDRDGLLREISLVTTEDAEQAGFWRRLWDSIVLFFRGGARVARTENG
ncbi:MAG: D-alanyl-D-alanine carboxypeptidase [Spirochaetaceae bacterium]|jgi:D-alanyl-D-alanine carboxypeptidase (penicillin-binding protein 5/6)|nr:D-alanyl-D-alanine carboxypeptidase [Spirochaetaceae bacterium]